MDDLAISASYHGHPLELLLESVPCFENFPQSGQWFRDFGPALAQAGVLNTVAKSLLGAAKTVDFDMVAGIEARGFTIAAALAAISGAGFAMIRKKGKLPGATAEQSFVSEYSQGILEVSIAHVARRKVLIVDDFLATGGTAFAAAMLLRNADANPVGYAFLAEAAMGGRDRLQPLPCFVAHAFGKAL